MWRRSLTRAALLLALFVGPTTADEAIEKTAESTSASGKPDAVQAVPERQGEAAPDSRRPAPRHPRVVFLTMKGCPRCDRELARLRRPKGDFEAMKARGWKIGEGPENHLQVVDRTVAPDLVALLKVREYPTVACINKGEVVRSFKDGCTTPLDSWTFGWLLKGVNERPTAPVLEPARVETTGSYPLRGNHWSVDGDWEPPRATVISHLRGPNHAGQIEASWAIESWSYEELRSLHDDLHERELGSGTAGSGGAYTNDSGPVESAGARGFTASGKLLGR